MLNLPSIVGLCLLPTFSVTEPALSFSSAKYAPRKLLDDNFLCYMQMSDGKTLNLENLCQPDQQKKEMSTQQESNSTDENDSNGEDNPDIDTSDDRFDRANSSENESDYPSDEFEENEP